MEGLGDVPWAVVLNQADRVSPAEVDAQRAALHRVWAVTTAVTGEGVDSLRQTLSQNLGESGEAELPLVTERRHAEQLELARGRLDQASTLLEGAAAEELLCLELREAAAALGRIIGRGVTEDVLDQIFSRFCLGK